MKHPYLSDTACVYRLLDEYKKYGSIVVAYDFDNTVFDYHGKDHDYSEVIKILQECSDLGFFMICFTAEEGLRKVNSKNSQ